MNPIALRLALRLAPRLCSATLIAVAACSTAPAWRHGSDATVAEVSSLLSEGDTAKVVRRAAARDVPEIPVRRRLRPCCAFGAKLGARLGPVPIPGYEITNILSPEDIGRHKYDSGMLVIEGDGEDRVELNREHNGLVYTCRGGFIDTAHVRDYIDWALWVASQLGALSETGGSFELPDEGATRRVRALRPPDEVVAALGAKRATVEAGIWLAFQLSIWHEIATWYGWAAVPGFPERASAFSPEDLYSNLLGAKLLAGIVIQRAARSESLFNDSADEWIAQAVDVLGGVPKETGMEMADAVDGLWWDSQRRLPDPWLVTRRNMETQSPIRPWLVPDSRLSEAQRKQLDAACPAGREPLPIPYAEGVGDIRWSDYITLEIEVDDSIADLEPFPTLGTQVTQRDFPGIIEVIRRQNAAEFGAGSDRPE